MIRSCVFNKAQRLDKYLKQLTVDSQLGVLTEIEVAERLLHYLSHLNLKLKDLDFGFSDPGSESD